MQLKYFIQKEFQHIRRDKRTLSVLLIIPVALVLLFGYAISTDISDADIAFYDKDNSTVSRDMINSFSSSGYFSIHSPIENHADITERFQNGDVKMVIVIPSNFGRDIATQSSTVQIICDGSDPNTASIIDSYAGQVIQRFVMKNRLAHIALKRVTPEIRLHYNPELKSAYMFVPGVMAVVLMLICAMLTSVSIAKEQEQGTLELIAVSPLNPTTIIMGKVIAYFIISLANIALILGVAYLVFQVPVRGNLILLIIECMIYTAVALSLGILISTTVSSQQEALLKSLFGLLMPTMLLSGFIFPVSAMPAPLQVVSQIVPAKHFLIIVRGIMLRGSSFVDIWQESAILLSMATLLLIISIKRFKIDL